MTSEPPALPAWIGEAVAEAAGRTHRPNQVTPGSGGPAGNVRLTAWLGICLLVLFIGELLTLFDVRGLITWHVVIGVLLVPPALVKTATTGWRIVRYYRHVPAYVTAGPPPTLLRVLGPLVVATTLALLGSGLALIALGDGSDQDVLLTALGQRVSPVTLHQGFFILWAVATGLHVLGRVVPAIRSTFGSIGRRMPGRAARLCVLATTAAVAAVLAVVLAGTVSGWSRGGDRLDHHTRLLRP